MTRGYDMETKTEICSMDVLYGYKTLDDKLAVKIKAKEGAGVGGVAYALASHTHKTADVTDAETVLAKKSHTHVKADVTDLES